MERRLFPWQQGRGGPGGKNGPLFSLDRDGHDEAEARSSCCGRTFWTAARVLVHDAKVMRGQDRKGGDDAVEDVSDR